MEKAEKRDMGEADELPEAIQCVTEIMQTDDYCWTPFAVRAFETVLQAAERCTKAEKAEEQLCGERDAAEQALSQAYYLITGKSPEWSNHWGYAECLEEIDAAQVTLRAYISPVS